MRNMEQNKNSFVDVFIADIHGNLEDKGFSKTDLAECNAEVQELAKDPSPDNRYKIAEVTTFVVDELLKESQDLIKQVADVKTVAHGEKAQFQVEQNDVTAYIIGKGATPLRSKIQNKFVTVDTFEIAARPYVNMLDLATGRLNISKLAVSATREMNYKQMRYVQEVLNAGIATVGANGYASTNSVKPDTFNKILASFRRMGNPRIIGDIVALDRIDGLIKDYGYAPNSIEEILRNGYVGHYKGVPVVGLENPIVNYALEPLLDPNFIYMLGGAVSPLKVVNEGGVRTMEQQNIDDESFEMVIRQDFGAAFVTGKYPTIGGIKLTA